mmetsp:Transcript_12559/g.37725  ORF Transcript_12559/g.37725 Transcript_12559/m.37725 type:complete len:279 (-) Transcript_12559:544-1380(-)
MLQPPGASHAAVGQWAARDDSSAGPPGGVASHVTHPDCRRLVGNGAAQLAAAVGVVQLPSARQHPLIHRRPAEGVRPTSQLGGFQKDEPLRGVLLGVGAHPLQGRCHTQRCGGAGLVVIGPAAALRRLLHQVGSADIPRRTVLQCTVGAVERGWFGSVGCVLIRVLGIKDHSWGVRRHLEHDCAQCARPQLGGGSKATLQEEQQREGVALGHVGRHLAAVHQQVGTAHLAVAGQHSHRHRILHQCHRPLLETAPHALRLCDVNWPILCLVLRRGSLWS